MSDAHMTDRRIDDARTSDARARDSCVLLVGFDEDSAYIFATALLRAGFSIRVLDEPGRVIEIAVAERARLVVTNFPTYASGRTTVTEMLRGERRTALLPILNVTSHVFAWELEAAAAAGVTMTLWLPTSPADLVAAAHRLTSPAAGAWC